MGRLEVRRAEEASEPRQMPMVRSPSGLLLYNLVTATPMELFGRRGSWLRRILIQLFPRHGDP